MNQTARFNPTINQVRDPEQLLRVLRDTLNLAYQLSDQLNQTRAQMLTMQQEFTKRMESQASVLDGVKSGAAAMVKLGLGNDPNSPIDVGSGPGGGFIQFNEQMELDNNARVNVKLAGVSVGIRRAINIINGAGLTITVTDDPGNEEVDIQFTVP